ncbi:MAG TPA: four helix bundle protein [Opitutaceae bacterium]
MNAEIMAVTRFEELDAWKRARLLVNAIYDLTRGETVNRDFGLTGQIQRASVSVMSNIAEGFERTHLAEKSQFYNIARGSSAEVRSLLYVIEDNYPEICATAVELREEVGSVGRLITGLIRSTETRKRREPLSILRSILF